LRVVQVLVQKASLYFPPCKTNIVFHAGFTNFEIMDSKSKVYFFFNDVKISIRNKSALKKFVEDIFKKEKIKLNSINYIFCSDKALLAINKKYLGKSDYTDIITFDLSEPAHPVQAEVYISTDRIKENAKSFNQSFSSEIYRVIFHGALHLCGYGDKKQSEKAKMKEKEDYYLFKFLK
jgi:probable rRNA maturation factor